MWDEYLYSVREKVKVRVTVNVTVCVVLLRCVGWWWWWWWWKEGRMWNPVPAHSLLFSKSTKGAARLNVPIRQTNRYQQYYMPSQHTYSAEEFLELYGKVEAVDRNCLLRWSGHLFEVRNGRGGGQELSAEVIRAPVWCSLVPTFSISVFALDILPFFMLRLEHFSAGMLTHKYTYDDKKKKERKKKGQLRNIFSIT